MTQQILCYVALKFFSFSYKWTHENINIQFRILNILGYTAHNSTVFGYVLALVGFTVDYFILHTYAYSRIVHILKV